MSKQLADDLAKKAVSKIINAGVREDVLAVLLKSVEENGLEAITEALLVVYGQATMERDRLWVQQLQGEWSPKSGLKTATNPAEVEADIRRWHAGRISEVRVGAFKQGFEDAFPVGVQQGIKLGWSACEAGKGLEEALKAGEKIRPT